MWPLMQCNHYYRYIRWWTGFKLVISLHHRSNFRIIMRRFSHILPGSNLVITYICHIGILPKITNNICNVYVSEDCDLWRIIMSYKGYSWHFLLLHMLSLNNCIGWSIGWSVESDRVWFMWMIGTCVKEGMAFIWSFRLG